MINYYEILEISKDATQAEIKKAYRRLSKKYHPDVNPEGGDMFKAIKEAYEVLTDPNKRAKHDNPFKTYGNNFSNFNSRDYSNFYAGDNPFNHRPKKEYIKNLLIEVEDLFNPSVKTVTFTSGSVTCDNCDGTGGVFSVCTRCSGTGCYSCDDEGKIEVDYCKKCDGNGFIKTEKTVTVPINEMVRHNDTLKSGEHKVIIKINDKGKFRLDADNNLHLRHLVSLSEILEDDLLIPHPNGKFNIKLTKGLDLQHPIRIKGKGLNNPQSKGDFYINVIVSKIDIKKNDISNLEKKSEEI